MAAASIVLFTIYALLVQSPHAIYATELVYQFPNETWVQNIAVRQDGALLVTLLTTPDLYLIRPNPKRPEPELIHRFDSHTGLVGITETKPNVFEIVATNFTFGSSSAARGSSAIYRVKFPSRNPHQDTRPDVSVSLTAQLPDDIGLPNGLVALKSHSVLLADSGKGNILSIDTVTGAISVWSSDPLLAPVGPLGVNGLKIHGSELYFTNSGKKILGRIPLDLREGKPAGAAVVVARGPPLPTDPESAIYDDFTLSSDGKVAYLTTAGGNTVAKVHITTGKQEVVAGELHSTEIAEPTAVAFGRGSKLEKGRLYVVTAGGLLLPVNGNKVVGGQVVRIDVGKGK